MTKLQTKVVDTEADILEGVNALKKMCPHMSRISKLTGPPPLRRWPSGFEGLSRIIIGQQLSIASANAIWEKVQAQIQPITGETVLGLSDLQLKLAGLSAAKCRTFRALSEELVSGRLDLNALNSASDGHVHEQLTRIHGIGPWTADIYILFCLGRPDGWAPGDLALQKAVQIALNLRTPPRAPEMVPLSYRWRPWRGIAARLLWEFYRVRKDV